ncbi:endonuclease/exonuclease/phosphatase family metal-dependent hydrolase [Catalinimonas alkaloidigena]|uniref:endonuclease/exonuclease/phosphatase family protein n=1 Tax=Catalinimonas alkaloidigena TaxID=1075417 RepID=UPI002404D247|nr:endonuclease/exonuclease/phosphatase family protein [Catalinimonas alkaloidigena]MDF9798730.1 endonuclease/exonuclease/phosphatase family metal-dependent hydrolase [Catalinimonas alkaloidigena]
MSRIRDGNLRDGNPQDGNQVGKKTLMFVSMLKINPFALVLGAALWAVSFSCTPTTSESSQENEAAKAVTELRVMAYNVHHCNPPSEAGKIDVKAVAETIRKQNPDLVALQEIDVMTGRSGEIDQAKMLAEQLEMNYYFGKAIDHDGGAYGVAILSRFPISEEQTHPLPTQAGTGGEARVLATVEVRLPDNRTLRFGSTHLDAQKENTNRLLQIKKIGELISDEELPIIIAGDLNATLDSEVIGILDQHFQRSCNDCPPTIPVLNPTKAIDFIAFRPQSSFEVLQHEVVSETYASDHLPVVAVLRLQ